MEKLRNPAWYNQAMTYQYKRESLNRDEVSRLEKACETARERMLVWTLLDTGLRISEFTSLSRDNIDWQGGKLIIFGKGGPYGSKSKRRVVPMSNRVHLLQTYATTAGVLTIADTYLQIKIGSMGVSKQNGHFEIGHEPFLDGNYYTQPSALVLENGINDGGFYNFIFDHLKNIGSLPDYRFDAINGGGDPTSQHFQEQIDNERVVVCVVDTDQKAPAGRKSSTCNKVIAKQRRNEGNFVGASFTTIVREIENFIPYHILTSMDCYKEKVVPIQISQAISSSNNMPEPYWYYFDIKYGLNVAEIKQKEEEGSFSPETASWVRSLFSCSEEVYTGIAFEGFGSKVIQNFMKCRNSRIAYIRFLTESECGRMFVDFFTKILWFFCCTSVVRV